MVDHSHTQPNLAGSDTPQVTVVRACWEELTGFLVVLTSIAVMLRHPFRFDHHLARDARYAAKFFFVSGGLATFFSKPAFMSLEAQGRMLATGRAVLPSEGPYGLDGIDAIPYALLLTAFIWAGAIHGVWKLGRRWLPENIKRRMRAAAPPRPPTFDTVARACLYAGGLVSSIYAAIGAVWPYLSKYTGSHNTAMYFLTIIPSLACVYSLFFILYFGLPSWVAAVYGVRWWALLVGYGALVVVSVPIGLLLFIVMNLLHMAT